MYVAAETGQSLNEIGLVRVLIRHIARQITWE